LFEKETSKEERKKRMELTILLKTQYVCGKSHLCFQKKKTFLTALISTDNTCFCMCACVYITLEVATSLEMDFTKEMQLIFISSQISLLYGRTVMMSDASY